jgi:hypothetical protein
MPIHAYKSYVGLAADRVNAMLTSAITTAAVSLPLQNTVGTTGTLTTTGATYSAIIVDGVNTETVACSGNLTAGAIACGATANAHPANVYVYFQLTASIGPTAYIPLEKFDPVDTYAQLLDESYRGSAVKTVGAVAGMRTSAFDLSGAVFADTVGYLLGGVFGSEDFTAGTPATHAFGVLNTAASQFQPVPYVLYNFDGYNTRIFAGGKFTDLTLTLDPTKLMMYTAKFMGRASGVVTTPTVSFSTLTTVPSWTGAMTIAGAVTLKCLTFDITFTREESEEIPTLLGIQDPYSVFVGPLTAKGKVTYVKEDDTQLANYFNETQPAIVISSAQGTGGTATALNVQMTKCNYNTAKVGMQGKSYVTEEIDYEGIANTTDATTAGGGLSPAKVTLKNVVATGVYV